MAQLIVGLDVGSHSIKVVGLERAMRGYLPVFFDEEIVPQDKDVDGKLLQYRVRAHKALDALRARGRLKADLIITGLPGDMATSRLLPIPFEDPKKIALVLPSELEAAVPFDLDDVVYDSLVLKGVGDEGVDVLVGLARKDAVREFLSLLKDEGVAPRHVELETLSLDQLRLHFSPQVEAAEPVVMTPGGTIIQTGPGAMPAATAVMDIGASRTNLCISTSDEVIAARTILRGGQDLTRELAKEYGLPLDEAERGKLREAYIEAPDAPSVYPEQQRISACLRRAMQPLLREIRQTFQGVVARRRVRIRRLVLTGGSSRIPNLDKFLAQELNIQVTLLTALDKALAPALPPPGDGGNTDSVSVPHAATAMAYALSGLAGPKTKRIDFRQGEFAHRGDYEYVFARAPQIAAGFMALALLGAFNAYARHFVISRQEAAVAQRQRDTCKAILGQPEDDGARCIQIMSDKINPNAGGSTTSLPIRSATDWYIQVALKMPKDAAVKVDSLDITLDKVRIKGKTDSFENVDKIVKALEGGECFKRVEKGPARQSGEKIEWSATVDLECPVTSGVPG